MSIKEELEEDDYMYMKTGDITNFNNNVNHSRKGSNNFLIEDHTKELTMEELQVEKGHF